MQLSLHTGLTLVLRVRTLVSRNATPAGRELVREKLDGNEGESFQLIPSYLEKLELMDPSTYTKLSLGPKMPDSRQRFQPLARARILEASRAAKNELYKRVPAAVESRYGHDTNNITESVNRIWDEIRNLPPLQMLEQINLWMMKTFWERS
ncbi:hypothetical protein DL98DRAFT_542899 [Cadophora sp. DSE1049]|nr:hypothetical protein DL98DRAFT_542899 [Cadophora sp. DSE1049]